MTLQGLLGYRPLAKRDAHPIFSHAHRDASLYQQPLMNPVPTSEEAVERWVARHERDEHSYCATITVDDHVAGFAALTKIRQGLDAEVSYWVAPHYRGSGLAKEALAHLEATAGSYGLLRLYAYVDHDNKSSAKSLERKGFTPIPGRDPFPGQGYYAKRLTVESKP